MTPSTQEQVQDAWRKRWADPVIEHPSCYNRESFCGVWKPGCSAWFVGGNAHVTAKLQKDKRLYSWANCNGCKQKGNKNASKN